MYSFDNIEYGFLKYYVLKTVTPLIDKLGELFDVSFNEFGLRNSEKLKIHCGNEHFKALEDNIKFFEEPVKDLDEFKVNI